MRAPVPAERNAATYLRQASTNLEAIDSVLQALSEHDQMTLESRSTLTQTASEAASATLEKHANVLPLLRRASECPDFDPEMDVTHGADAFWASIAPDIKLIQRASVVLKCHALLLIADSRPEEALTDVLTMLRLARLLEGVPTAACYSATTACRRNPIQIANLALRAGSASDRVHEMLETELGRINAIKRFRWALVSDRPVGLQHLREFYGTLDRGWYRKPLLSETIRKDYDSYLDQFDDPLRLVEQPYGDIVSRIVDFR
jgi:hypothetical protein